MTLRASLGSPTELTQVLPGLLESLSIARGQIVLDQLQSAVRNKGQQEILLVTLSEPGSSVPVAAAIAIHDRPAAPRVAAAPHPTGLADHAEFDAANLLHAGPSRPYSRGFDAGDLAALSKTLDQVLAQRGVRFVQWATDIPEHDGNSKWCHGLGFYPVARLHYLSGPIPIAAIPERGTADEDKLEFVPLDWSGGEIRVREFSSLLQRTYLETLDCPRLAEFRTASQTIDAYRRTASFAPALWFHIQDQDRQHVGCLILAEHTSLSNPAAASNDADLPEEKSSSDRVFELVYMGLIPSARGRGRGRQLFNRAIEIATNIGAVRLILAVDEANTPARTIYETAGLRPVMHESVWVKGLKPHTEP